MPTVRDLVPDGDVLVEFLGGPRCFHGRPVPAVRDFLDAEVAEEVVDLPDIRGVELAVSELLQALKRPDQDRRHPSSASLQAARLFLCGDFSRHLLAQFQGQGLGVRRVSDEVLKRFGRDVLAECFPERGQQHDGRPVDRPEPAAAARDAPKRPTGRVKSSVGVSSAKVDRAPMAAIDQPGPGEGRSGPG